MTPPTPQQRRAQGGSSSSSCHRGGGVVVTLRNHLHRLVVGVLVVVWTTTSTSTSTSVSAFTTTAPFVLSSTTTTRIGFTTTTTPKAAAPPLSRAAAGAVSPLYTFYNDFEDFDKSDDDDEDEDEEDDSEEEEEELDEQSIADFRAKMGSMFGTTEDDKDKSTTSRQQPSEVQDVSSVDELIQFARSQAAVPSSPTVPKEWAKPVTTVGPGTILVANPEKFCPPSSSSSPLGLLGGGPNPSLLAKFGLTRPPPKDLGPDRQADLLPVLVVVEKDDTKSSSTCRGVLLNRRTGYLLGDLEQPPPSTGDGDEGASASSPLPPILEKFCIQPLWFGGIDNISTGLDMLHLCPAVPNAKALTEDGLYWGGDPAQAQEAMEDPSLDGRVMTGFDFKFFVQSTIWSNQDLQQEIVDGVWFPAQVSKEILFKSRDRMGTQKAKPLWTEIMELLGGNYQTIKDQFYDNDDEQ